MMRARLTYVPLEVADQFGDFIIKRDEQILDAVRAKTKDYSTLSLLKLLYQLRGTPMTFSDLYSKSKIRMKKSFLNYLHLCRLQLYQKRASRSKYDLYDNRQRTNYVESLYQQRELKYQWIITSRK